MFKRLIARVKALFSREREDDAREETVPSDSPDNMEPVQRDLPTDSKGNTFAIDVVNGTRVMFTVSGSGGSRVYYRDLDSPDDVEPYLDEACAKVVGWVGEGHSLYRCMGSLLQLKRAC